MNTYYLAKHGQDISDYEAITDGYIPYTNKVIMEPYKVNKNIKWDKSNVKTLADERCPKCNSHKKLAYDNQLELYTCTETNTDSHCGFSIYAKNFKHMTRFFKKNDYKYAYEN